MVEESLVAGRRPRGGCAWAGACGRWGSDRVAARPGGGAGAVSGFGFGRRLVAVSGSRPHPRHPPARRGTGTFRGPIPGTAVGVLVLVAASAGGGGLRIRARGVGERGCVGVYRDVFSEGCECGRPRSSVASPGGFTEMSNARNEGHGP